VTFEELAEPVEYSIVERPASLGRLHEPYRPRPSTRNLLPRSCHLTATREILMDSRFSQASGSDLHRLERLQGRLKGKHSIRVNDQYRIVFIWKDGNASDVLVTDYH
jgi:proteic killer suppression protein